MAASAVSSLISSSGVTSGIDSSSIINSLIEVERQAITPTETKKTAAESQLTVVQELNTLFSYALTDAEDLLDAENSSAKSASSSDDDLFTATATAAAAAGTYAIRIDALAQAEQKIGTAVTTSATFSGTLTVAIGNGDAFSYTATDSTLTTMAKAINANTTAKVKAEVVDVGDGTSRLLLTSKATGSANTITLGGDLATSGPFASVTTLTNAQDAKVTMRLGIDSTIELTRTSSSNAMTNLVDGATVTLAETSNTFATLTIASNTEQMAEDLSSFVTSLNSALTEYGLNSGYDSATSTSGVLFSNSQTRSQVAAIKKAMDGVTSDGRSLEALGITYDQSTGLYKLDSSVLSTLLANEPDAIKTILSDSGLGTAVKTSLENLVLKDAGVFTTLEDSLTESISSYADRITAFDEKLEVRKARYQKQFLAMETAIAKLNSQKTALTSFIDGLNSSD